MPRKYDAIVIGAGLGGLSAAAMLAKHGLGVLLLERHNVPGGYATSFTRGRYEFETALHALSGIGTPERRGTLYRFLEELGVHDRLEFVRAPNFYRSVLPGIDLTLPAGTEAYTAALCEAFPHEARGIRRLMARVMGVYDDFNSVVAQRGVGNPVTMPVRFPHLFRYMPTVWGDVINRDVRDERARAVISQIWPYFGLPPSQVSCMYFAVGLSTLVRDGIAYVRGRSQALSQAILMRFEELGGEARVNCGVRRITTSDGRVTGVITETDEEFDADWVISNADPVTTCRDMIGVEHVPADFFTNLRSSELAPSIVNVYLGLACSPQVLGLGEYEIFVNRSYDYDHQYRQMQTIAPQDAVLIAAYSTIYPDVSPPGTSIVVLSALAAGRPWFAIPPERYVETKNRIADSMIDLAGTVIPGLRECIEVVEVATPLTTARYTGALGGSIYGAGQPPHDNTLLRMSPQGPLEGLYFVGAWTRPGGGFQPVMRSGQMAAGGILRQIKAQSTAEREA